MGDEKGRGWFDIQIDVEVLFSKFIYLMFHNTLYGNYDSIDTEKYKKWFIKRHARLSEKKKKIHLIYRDVCLCK